MIKKPESNHRVLILGATGAVGAHALQMALASKQVAHVIAPTRKPLQSHPKLDNPIIDFDHLDSSASFWAADSIICALGTTIKQAGSQQAFAKIDHDLVLTIARFCKENGATVFALNSSLGANLTGNFYLKTKAQIEADISSLEFASYTIVRPSLIDTDRAESRPGETIGLMFARTFKPLIPKKYRAVPAQNIAKALLEACIHPIAGQRVIESDQL
jgi:uncharacterized protein YbjT (DUF2867 family)